ncbi:MAG TPA: PQQ-binding-like beta-propeller repeat protein, partial [Chitinophagaceae bacterium]|nr:PQQ-binding-like beta-propeller repeat protein [Chitinophagaceae bacterium]
MKRLVQIFFFLFSFSTVVSQQITFERYYDTLNCFSGSSVQQTFDKGFIVTGVHSVSMFNNNVVLFKTDSIGDLIWIKSYGGPNNDGGQCVKQTNDSGYIVVGTKDIISTSDSKIWLLKTDKNGDTLWTKAITAGLGANIGYYVEQTADTGYIICGYTSVTVSGNYDAFLIKTNLYGDTLWTRKYGGPIGNAAFCVRQTTDGGYIVAGSYGVAPFNADVFAIKTDPNGDTLWTKKYGGYRGDAAYCVDLTSDGGYIFGGMTTSFSDTVFWDMYLVKTDVNGDTLWTKDIWFPRSDNIYSIKQMSDNGYMIIGNRNLFPIQEGGVAIVRTDAVGDTLWT